MSTVLRNVEADLAAPVGEWPFEAVLAVLERGDITSWSRLAIQVRADPWGPVARKVEEALEIAHPYGVEPLLCAIVSSARTQREQAERQEVVTRIRRAIASGGLTRAQFAERIGTSASRLSTYATGQVVPSAAMLIRIEALGRATHEADSPGIQAHAAD